MQRGAEKRNRRRAGFAGVYPCGERDMAPTKLRHNCRVTSSPANA